MQTYNCDKVYIKAKVKSFSKNKFYEVCLNIDEKMGLTDYKCECASHEVWYSKGLCKHIIAVLIKYGREKHDIKRKKTFTNTDNLIENINAIKQRNIKGSIHIKMEPKYEFISNGFKSNIELKVGEDKLYVVKNLKEFMTCINEHKSMEFGKGFTYNPVIHSVREEDENLLRIFQEIYEVELLVGDSFEYYGNRPKLMSGKKAVLTNIQLDKFFKTMENREFVATIDNNICNNIRILKDDLPLEFVLEKKGEGMFLKFDSEMPLPLNGQGDYFYYNGNIYNPTEEKKKIFIPFFNQLINSKTKGITFVNEDKEKIAAYIIPALRKISPKLKIDKKLQMEFYEEKLKVSTYFDKEDENVTAELKFTYGNIDINPLNDEWKREGEKVLIREMENEEKLQNNLASWGFTKGKSKYILSNEEKLIEFLSKGIHEFQELGEVYYSDVFKNIKLYNSSSIKSSIRLNEDNLLEFKFDISGIDKTELKDIFTALREKKKYYKLKKGGFISLGDKEIKDVSTLIDYLDIKDSDLEKDKILLSRYNALYIEQNLKDNGMDFIQRNKGFKELVNNVRDVKEMDFTIPEHLEDTMRGYQKVGFKWFKTLSTYGFGGILADEMGLGKTLQAIAFVASEVAEKGENRKPALVVAPSSLLYNWKNEVVKFAPNLKVLIVSGPKGERENMIKEVKEADIVVTSYPLIRRDIDEYKDITFSFCFLDEAQQIKNPMSVNAKSVKEIKAEGYFAITGTPIENSLTELWSIFDFVMPGYLLSHSKFSKKYETPISKNKDAIALKELNKHVQPFILRRLKKDVVKELPPKIEHKVEIELTDEQKKVYMAYLESAKAELNDEIKDRGFNRSKIKILATLTRLRQICCEPSVFIENFQGDSGKMLALDEILSETLASNHRVLLFSQFTSVLKIIENRIKSNGITYKYLDGNTKSEDRMELVDEFNNGDGEVFLISLKAGGTGLNLTGADVVIHFDPWWNPAVEDQATDRAHRIGQKKTVEVIKLVARGTIEEKIYILQEKKKQIINNVMDIESREENIITQMSENEIRDLFEM